MNSSPDTLRLRVCLITLAAASFINGSSATEGIPSAGGDTLTGPDSTSSQVKAFTDLSFAESASFIAFPGFTGGARVAGGDINGDGAADIIVGPGSGASTVKVFDGRTQLEVRSFDPYPGFQGGIFVGAGDVNGDGFADIITGTGSTTTHVKVFSGQNNAELRSFIAFPGFTGGVRVAGGDVNGDGVADIITGTGPGGAQVKVLSGTNSDVLKSFIAYQGFTGGIFVAGGDINGDNLDDVATAPNDTSPHVKVFSGNSNNAELRSFFAFAAGFAGGVRVALGDVNRDGFLDIIAGTGPGANQVAVFNSQDLSSLGSFSAYSGTQGVFVGHLGAPVNVLGAVSRKMHGASGLFDINLPLTGTAGIECRSGPVSTDHQVIITFSEPVTFESATVTSGQGQVANAAGSGTSTFTVDLTGVGNAQTLTLTLASVSNGANTTNVPVRVGFLAGDSSANGSVNSSDIGQIKAAAASGQTVTNSNFRLDVTASGSPINSSDISLAKTNSGKFLPP